MPILSGGTASLSLPLDLGPGLFQIDAHGNLSITPNGGGTALTVTTSNQQVAQLQDLINGTLVIVDTGFDLQEGGSDGDLVDKSGNVLYAWRDGKKLALYGATPVVQPGAITPPSGGAIQDAEARTAIAAILAVLGAAAGGIGITA